MTSQENPNNKLVIPAIFWLVFINQFITTPISKESLKKFHWITGTTNKILELKF